MYSTFHPLPRAQRLQGCWGGTIINGLATSKGIKQFSKPKISFMGWTDVILGNVFRESPKDTLMGAACFRHPRVNLCLNFQSHANNTGSRDAMTLYPQSGSAAGVFQAQHLADRGTNACLIPASQLEASP